MSDELTSLRAMVGELEILVKQWREYACGQRGNPPGEADAKPLVDEADVECVDDLVLAVQNLWINTANHAREAASAWSRIRQALHPQGGMRTNFWHFLAHLFGMNGCVVEHAMKDGHLWIFAACATCRSKRLLAHSLACGCPGLIHSTPDMHTETPNPIHDTQTQGSQKCD